MFPGTFVILMDFHMFYYSKKSYTRRVQIQVLFSKLGILETSSDLSGTIVLGYCSFFLCIASDFFLVALLSVTCYSILLNTVLISKQCQVVINEIIVKYVYMYICIYFTICFTNQFHCNLV